MLRITGYSDKYTSFPGEEIKFYVNAEKNENYEVQIVRLIHGDTNPEGPGYKDEEIGAECNRNYQGKNQKIHGGSYIVIPQDERLNTTSFTLQAYIFPTTPDKGKQGILTKWNDKTQSGYGLFIGRFADALGEVAAKMTLDEIQENRGQFVKQVANIANESIGHTGLALETVSIISLDQAPIEMFNPANTFDSQGLTQLTEQIEERKKKRNDITQDTKISIENKNLETVQKELEIKKNEEFSKYQQEREIAIQRAKEKTETIKEKAEKEREAEEAEIRSQEQIEVAKISQNQVIEVERKLTETRLIEEIEKRRKEQNELEKNSAFEIRQKDLETEVKILNLDKESEYARLEKQRQVDIKRAQEKAAIIKEQSERQKEAEEAQIVSEQQVKNAKIEQQKNIDSHRIESERVVRLLDIEKAKRLSIEEHQKNLEVINKSKQVLKSKAEEENSRARAIEAEEKANSARYVEKAQGIKKVDVITAASKAEQDRHATMAAKLRYEIDAAGKEALNSAEKYFFLFLLLLLHPY